MNQESPRVHAGECQFVSTSSHWGDRGFVGGLGRGGASGSALPGRAGKGMEGLLVGWGEAEPLALRYQAEPGREGRVCWWVGARRSLWICVTRQSLGTRDFVFKLSHDRNNGVKIKILILIYKLRMNPQKFAASVLYPHQATKARIFCF